MAVRQAGVALHTMAILQAYQAEVLKEMDKGDGVTPEAVTELRRATDLALRATKHTGRAVGRSMAGLVATERHLWLNLTEIREKVFLLDALVFSSGLFGDAVNAIVDKLRAAKTQSAAFKQFMPRRAHEPVTASSSRERPAPRKEPVGTVSDPAHPPPYTVWGAQSRSVTRKRVDSSGSHSLSSIPGALSCHHQDGQYGGGVTNQSPGRLPVAHPGQACASTSPGSGPYPRGPEPSGGLSVKTETQVGGMDTEPPDGGADLGAIRRGRGGPLCVSGDPMYPLVLPFSRYLSGDRQASTPLAGHETTRFPSGQAHPSGLAQGEDLQSPPSPSSPVLAFPDMVLGVGLSSGR